MAKRTSNRSESPNDGAGPAAQPKARRSRATARPADTITAAPDLERTDNDDEALNAASGDEQPASAMSMDSDERTSSSMVSEPSAEDIRMRAYHRYLERGGGHGMDFEDWLEAERELKKS
jgi:hypothetical protein